MGLHHVVPRLKATRRTLVVGSNFVISGFESGTNIAVPCLGLVDGRG